MWENETNVLVQDGTQRVVEFRETFLETRKYTLNYLSRRSEDSNVRVSSLVLAK